MNELFLLKTRYGFKLMNIIADTNRITHQFQLSKLKQNDPETKRIFNNTNWIKRGHQFYSIYCICSILHLLSTGIQI